MDLVRFTQTLEINFILKTLSKLILLLSILYSTHSRADQRFSIDDALSAAFINSEMAKRFEAEEAALLAEAETLTVISTPQVNLSYERVAEELEFSAFIEQPFDLSRWRSALRTSVSHRAEALRAEQALWRSDVRTRVLDAFYRVLYYQNRLVAYDAWTGRLDRALNDARARERRGDVSGYQLRRIEREIYLAQTRRSNERLAQAEASTELAELTGWDLDFLIEGNLRPSAEETIERKVSPELERLARLELALVSEAEAYGLPALRDWSLGAGYRHTELGQEVGHGFLMTLSFPLALWNNDSPRLREIEAKRIALRTESVFQKRILEKQMAAAEDQLAQALFLLTQREEASALGKLTRLAQVSFDAGESSIVDLLDAFESEFEVQLATIEMEWEARRASNMLRKFERIEVSK